MKKENTANENVETEERKVLHLELKQGSGNGKVVSSPLKLILSIMACVFFFEAVIMIVLSRFPHLSVGAEVFIDAILATILITPLVYLFVYRQLNEHIRKRKVAESAHEKSEEHLRSVVESAAEPIISMDHNGNVIFWNAVAEDVFGYKKEEMLGQSASILMCDDEKDEYLQFLDRTDKMEDGGYAGKVLGFKAKRKDGSRFPAEFSLAKWKTDDGEFFTAVIRDISERRHTDEALAASRQMFLTVLDTIPVRVFWKDKDLNYLGCNMPFARDAGLASPINIIGKDDFQMSWRDQAELYREDDRKVLESGESKLDFEEPQTSPDGKQLCLRTSKIPLRNRDGEVFGVLGVYEDITERKLARDALNDRTRQQAVVAELGQLALSGVELQVLFDYTVRTLVDTLNIEYSKILELLPGEESLLLSAGAGWKEGLVDHLIINTGLESQAGYTLSAKEPVIVTDLNTEERFGGPTLLADHDVVSGMSVIIGNEDEPFGVIGVHSKEQRAFTSDDVNFLQAVANVLAEAVRRKGAEDSFQTLFKNAAESTGDEFFYKTVDSLGEWIGADCVVIGEFTGDGKVDTLAMVLDDNKVDSFSYVLPGSPCEEASQDGFCMYPEKVTESFPEDTVLIEMGAEGYAGVPLKDSEGRSIGILCAISRSKLNLPAKGREIFEVIAARVEVEVERRRAEESLKENEEKYSSLFENMLNGFAYHKIVLDEDNRPVDYIFLETNRWFENLTGLKREDIIGKRVTEVIPDIENDKFDWIGEYGKIAMEGGELRVEQYAEPLGKWYSILSYSNKKGYFAVVFEDITERKHAEEEKRKLNQAIEQSPAVVVITDVEGSIEYVNPKFTETTGYTLEEVKGENPRILNSGHTSKEEYRELWETIKSGKEWNGEFLNKKKNGDLFCESATISPVMDKDGKITNFIAVKEDVTEKKRAELMITRIGRILEDSLNEIYIFDAESLNYLEANHGAQKNLGYSMDELSALTPVDLKPDMTRDEFEKILEPLRSGREKKIQFNALHKRKDGSTFPAEIHLQTTTFESVPAFVSIILDQTKHMEIEEEKKRLQAQLLQAQKMEAVGVLAAGVAHDFNNILTIIRLRAENAMEEVGEESLAYEDMKEACEASKNASDLTRQLLLFSRKQALEFVSGDLNVTIVSLFKMLGRLLGENYSVKTDLASGLKHAMFDRGGIEQMVVNLVINARDSMSDGGSILIKTENVRIETVELSDHPDKKTGDFVRLSVIDSGVGMDIETQNHIFEPFFTTKGVGKGTGLGLSVVYGIIMQHDGWVEVNSEAGKGTNFDLYIPISTEVTNDTAEQDTDNAKPSGEGKRILLVEDEAGLRQITAKLLRTSGFEVFEAEDYKKAQALFKKEKGKFDLLLSDVILPDKTGIDLAEELLAKNPDLKLVLCSGYTDDRSQWPLIRERGYKFLQKPYSLDELLSMIMEGIAG
jgi:PAS domain S-box-containing protein